MVSDKHTRYTGKRAGLEWAEAIGRPASVSLIDITFPLSFDATSARNFRDGTLLVRLLNLCRITVMYEGLCVAYIGYEMAPIELGHRRCHHRRRRRSNHGSCTW